MRALSLIPARSAGRRPMAAGGHDTLAAHDPVKTKCLPGTAMITGRTNVIDVTPQPGKGPKVEW